MGARSVVNDARQVNLAIELITLGARLQVLEAETTLSRERLLRLYKEVQGKSPPKGMLPFSTDWFMTWQPNIHASLFMNVHGYLVRHAETSGIEATVRAYRLYLENLRAGALEPVLSFTRAWTLVRYFQSGMLTLVGCGRCSGQFVAHAYDLHERFVCGLCHVPARAGKTKAAREECLVD
ncbi:MAG: flagellar transcriptional regulator FlhC [Burkholderiales bacterium]|nr:flagellar transcriptional regulator FlhC [Burkholderiales bacterium]